MNQNQTADAPAPAALIKAFINTRDVEAGTDEFASAAGLGGWLRSQGLVRSTSGLDASDLKLAVALREALRTSLIAHHDGDVEPAAPALGRLARDLPLRVVFPAGGPRLEPADGGVRGALEQVLASVSQSVADGSWPRLKVCPADDCSWAFYDTSKNRSRTWCSMQTCGNRAKTRTFRARQAGS